MKSLLTCLPSKYAVKSLLFFFIIISSIVSPNLASLELLLASGYFVITGPETLLMPLVFMLILRGYLINALFAVWRVFSASFSRIWLLSRELLASAARQTLFSVSEWPRGRKPPTIPPPSPCEQARRGEAAFVVTGSSLSHRAESPDRQGIRGQWPVALTASESPASLRGWLDGWICDIKSDDTVSGVYVKFQEMPGMKEFRASGVMSCFVKDELTMFVK